MEAVEPKTCIKCGETKALSEFYGSRRSKDGHHSYCKACASASARQWTLDHPEKARATARASWNRLAERKAVARKARRDADPEKFRDQHRASYQRNIESAHDQMRRYRQTPGAKEHELVRRERYRTEGRFVQYSRRHFYGLEPAAYEALLALQDRLCAICLRELVLEVDHDHTTGVVRALLCGHCNRGLGHYKDDPVLLRAAADYLDRFK